MKQVIVVNMMCPMSIGRLAAQAAHASLLAILQSGSFMNNESFNIDLRDDPEYYEWLKEKFTKVMLRGWGDDFLRDLQFFAKAKGIRTGLMQEEGHITALALGPDTNERLDPLTRSLPTL